jgi:serum/glucocorticoid-regulated kinase 2
VNTHISLIDNERKNINPTYIMLNSTLDLPGIVTVTLHEAVGLSGEVKFSESDGYKEYSDASRHSHNRYKENIFPCIQCRYPPAFVEYDKCQIPLNRYWGTTETPSWKEDYGICKFYVTQATELTISLHHPTGSKFSQGVFLKLARIRPFNALEESLSNWLPIEDGIGSVRVSCGFAAIKNNLLKEKEFDGQFYGVERKHSGDISQNAKGRFEIMYAGKQFKTHKLSSIPSIKQIA